VSTAKNIARLALSLEVYADALTAQYPSNNKEKRERAADIKSKLKTLGWNSNLLGYSLTIGDNIAWIAFSPTFGSDAVLIGTKNGKRSQIDFHFEPAYHLAEMIDQEARKLIGGEEKVVSPPKEEVLDIIARKLHNIYEYEVSTENNTVVRATKAVSANTKLSLVYDTESGNHTAVLQQVNQKPLILASGKIPWHPNFKGFLTQIVEDLDEFFENALVKAKAIVKKQEEELEQQARKIKQQKEYESEEAEYQEWKSINLNKFKAKKFEQRLKDELGIGGKNSL
jgi:hypothetical protein